MQKYSLNKGWDRDGLWFLAEPVHQPGDGKVMVQMIPYTVSSHMKDKTVIMNSQHRLMTGKPY